MKSLRFVFLLLALLTTYNLSAQQNAPIKKGSVVFIHPDGTSLAVWNAARLLYAGPDGNLNWDKMSHIGLYRGHMLDALTATSNAGGTTHAYGVKSFLADYGMIGNETPTARSGKKMSIMKEAMAAGIKTGLVNSGSIIEPGTSAFVASVKNRNEEAEIARQVVYSGVDLILYGGEEWLLPEGVKGFYTQSGKRTDGLNLIEKAKELGYKVIYTREELLNIPANTGKLLGIFAEGHTFNDKSEEELAKLNLKNYKEEAPTLAEMTNAAIKILSQGKSRFFLMVEEEGTDNFGNKNNASGTLEALKRADDALGVVLNEMKKNPDLMLITTSDSEAGGMEVIGFTEERLPFGKPAPKTASNGNSYDGANGVGTPPFISAPDRNGKQYPFVIAWSTSDDVYGSVLVRAEGLNAHLVKGSVDNTDIYKFVYATLFGVLLP